MGENRSSGRDQFQVKIYTQGENPVEIPNEIIDNDDGQYIVKYQMNEEQKVKCDIQFLDDKGKWVPVRGSPYSASFNSKTPASANNLTGTAMTKHIPASMERLSTFMKETLQGAQIKDKDLTDTKVLISIKDNVELVTAENDRIMLQLDQVDESLKLL